MKQQLHDVSCGAHLASTVTVRVICWKSYIWKRPAQIAEFLTYSGNTGLECWHEHWLFWRRSSVALLIHFKQTIRLHLTLGHGRFPSHLPNSLEGTVATQSWIWIMLRLMYLKVKPSKTKSEIMTESRIMSASPPFYLKVVCRNTLQFFYGIDDLIEDRV